MERLLEGTQHVLPRGEVGATGGHLRAQELTHGGDLVSNGGESFSPTGFDNFVEGTSHGCEPYLTQSSRRSFSRYKAMF
ncbi:hypothetical protein GCM10017774_46860 [Lentzea cavernae]|uniref:Uncharacterized protein n=1 Tax=Lentzea cavernae TaxID=2020703 RepID=A0ABQ3MKI1_9PSEU|nr:hypothetical protein GCM10017774_46860 [Lentzea cavernae]